jgi:hypothetical protein
MEKIINGCGYIFGLWILYVTYTHTEIKPKIFYFDSNEKDNRITGRINAINMELEK